MKIFNILFTTSMLAVIGTHVLAQESVLPPTANKSVIEDNLLLGLASDNAGLQRSSALLLGTIKSNRAMAPLMYTLWYNPNENVRIAAAWALCQIGDINGTNAVFNAAKNDPSLKAMLTYAWYYNTYVQKGAFKFKKALLATASE